MTDTDESTRNIADETSPSETSQFETKPYETKVLGGPTHRVEIPFAEPSHDELMLAFEAFKQTNDERLRQIEQKLAADILTEDKLERINRDIDRNMQVINDLAIKARRPELFEAGWETPDEREHKSAFEDYMRKGNEYSLRQFEQKSLSASADSEGGYLVPDEWERTILRSLRDVSPMRAIASVRQVSSSVFKKPFSVTGPETGWVGEKDPRPETAAPALAELSFPTMELYAMPAATSTLLDDAAVNVDSWIADEVRAAFADQEGAAFVIGDGANKPRGFLDYEKVENSSWTWGKLGYLVTGSESTLNAEHPNDSFIDLIFSLNAGYRQNSHWVMNRSVQAELRKIKDADGNYQWRPGETATAAATFMNYPIVEAEEMPNIEAQKFFVAFGDFSRGYLIVDRIGIRVLRDPYSSKPYVLFYTTKRVGGGVQDFEAIKLLKIGTN